MLTSNIVVYQCRRGTQRWCRPTTHDAIFGEVDISQKKITNEKPSVRVYSKINRDGCLIFLNKWSEEFETNKNGKDANELWIEFKDALNHSASNFIPSKKIRKQDRLPWINRKTRSLVEKRNKAFRDMKNLKSEEYKLKSKT